MPMEAGYFDQLKSPVADMKNTGGRAGGSITAALFLKQFVKDEVEWSHLDVAGERAVAAARPAGTCCHLPGDLG